MGYDGAVDGVKILGGVAVEAEVASGMGTAQAPNIRRPGDGEIELIIQRAIEVIGSREEAMRWLGTPVPALGFATPISCLHDAAGREQVLAALTNLEHGVL
jgi:hypothetical protein